MEEMSPTPAPVVDPKWTTLSTRLVKPEVGKDPEWMELTPLDFLFNELFSSYLFLYKPKSEGGEIDALPLDGLIRSLSKTLVYFYPLAGRLIKNAKDDPVRLHCNNVGAVWIHKRYDGVLSEIIDEYNYEADERFSGLADTFPQNQEVYDPSGRPTLIIQVTEFQCGTTVLSPSWSHMVADGFSSFHFLKSWAEISRGESISLIPVHNRSLLSVKGAMKPEENVHTTDSLNLKPQTACKTLTYSKRRIEELKAEGRASGQSQNGCDGGKFLSTASCVFGHMWREMVRAHAELEPRKGSQFLNIVDCRSRITNFPAGYFGNCITVAVASATIGDILSKPLQYAATRIHEAARSIDEEAIRRFIYSLALDSNFRRGSPFDTTHTLGGSWMIRFPFYELDFGSGIPTNVLRNIPGRTIVEMVYVFPSSPIMYGLGDLVFVIEGEGKLLENLSNDQ
ncbi:hypothetical protein Mapa_000851 [Marchantia paleacea]|nr:hypothetical protein Mapa_000851 [Marchantia paleacea]